jgi:hypothetical protein
MNTFFKVALRPLPEVEKFDTSLRYTDILFGFVIRELFLRLQNWAQLDGVVRLHLLVGITLVIGSWIGYRRSLYRSGYQVKFFNMPLIRFIIDQVMLILYFRLAVLTEVGGKQQLLGSDLSRVTIRLVLYVFILYAIWDILGIWMAKAKTIGLDGNVKPLYPRIIDSTMSGEEHPVNWQGFSITVGSLVLIALISWLADCLCFKVSLLAAIVLLLLYRWAKEVRTSSQLLLHN